MAGNVVVGILRAIVTADTKGFEAGVKKAKADTKGLSDALSTFGSSTKAVGGLLTAGLTAPLLGMGAAVFNAGAQFDSAFKAIRASTGATGQTLAGLTQSFQNVFVGGAESAEIVADALSDVHKRTGLVGEPLEQLTRQMLDFADVTGSQVAPLVASTTRLFGDWSIATEKQGQAMDFLFKTSQQTGVGVDQLSQRLVQFGAPMRTFGFSFEEAAALMGKWEQEGVNVELVLGSLRIAAGKFAKENIPMREGLEAVIKRIQELGPSSAATAIAMEIFGRRAGADMADAIHGGRFAIEELVRAIEGSGDTIAEADRATETLSEAWGQVKNQFNTALGPIGKDMVKALQDLKPFILDVARGVADVTQWFAQLDPSTKKAILAIGGVLAALGPLLIGLGTFISAIGTALPLLKLLGPVLTVAFSPIGLIAAALAGMVVIWVKWGDDITRVAKDLYTDLRMLLNEKLFLVFTAIDGALTKGQQLFRNFYDAVIQSVTNLYNGIKTWLNEKLFAVFTAIKAPLDKVKALFHDMYMSVVGGSDVKDTVTETGEWFGKLEQLMVKPTQEATTKTAKAFEKLAEQGRGWINTLEEMRIAQAAAQLAFEQSGKRIDVVSNAILPVHTAALRDATMAWRDLDAAGQLLSADMPNIELAMAETAQAARIVNQGVSETPGLFERLRDIGIQSVGSLNSIFQAAFTGGGGMLGAVKSFAAQTTEALLGMIPVVGPVLSQFAGTIVAMFSKIAGKLKDLFGGPSAEELAGREVVAKFEDNIARMLTDQQRVEAGNEAWKRTVILVRDAYLALGRTEAEALRDVKALWESSKGGAEAAHRAILPIQEALEAVGRTGADAADDLRFSFRSATDDIERMKEIIAEPIAIRVSWDVEHPQSTRGGDVAFARSASTEDIQSAVGQFLRDNPGDEHRIGAALGLSPGQLRDAGIPGFARGTPGLRALDFGAGTLAVLHGSEAIVPQDRLGAFADRHADTTALVREVAALRGDLARRDQELTRLNQVLPTMVAMAVRDQLQLGSRRQ